MSTRTTIEPGVRKCVADDGTITYEARIKDSRTGRTFSERFARLAHAKKWRAQMAVDSRYGILVAPPLEEYAAEFIQRLRSGEILRASGDPYRDYTIDGYDRSLRLHILPTLGRIRLDRITHRDIQTLANDLAKKQKGATTRNALNALSTLLRYARFEGYINELPTVGVRTAARGRRSDDVVIAPEKVPVYLDALDPDIRLAWSLMFYAGLRIGEALGLEWSDVQKGTIKVRQQMLRSGKIAPPKTRAGVRTIPIVAPLADDLKKYGDRSTRFVCGDDGPRHFIVSDRAARRFRQYGLERTMPHAARHTFASMMIATGKIDAKMLSVVLGHESIATTLDIYGHLYPSSYDAFLNAANEYLRWA